MSTQTIPTSSWVCAVVNCVLPDSTVVVSVNSTRYQVRSLAWPAEARSNVSVVASVTVPQTIFWAMFVPVPEAEV